MWKAWVKYVFVEKETDRHTHRQTHRWAERGREREMGEMGVVIAWLTSVFVKLSKDVFVFWCIFGDLLIAYMNHSYENQFIQISTAKVQISVYVCAVWKASLLLQYMWCFKSITCWTQTFKMFESWPWGCKTFSCSTQLSVKFILLINVKMPTIVGILTFINRINTTFESFKVRKFFIFHHFSFYEQLKFHALLSWAWKKFYNLGARSWKWSFLVTYIGWYGPQCKKTCHRGFWPSKAQTILLSYRDWL